MGSGARVVRSWLGLETHTPFLCAVSGAGAGAAMVAISHPLSQVATNVTTSNHVAGGSTLASARRALNMAGVRALYKNAPIMSSAVSSGICLGAFDVICRGMKSGRDQQLTPLEVGEAGCAAASVAAVLERRCVGFVSRYALSTGIFFGTSNLVRTRCFSQENVTSVPALLVGGSVGGAVSEAARVSMENMAVVAKSPSAGFKTLFRGMGPQVARSLPGTMSFVMTASAIQKFLS